MKTILLIEDNDLIRENTAEILELAGYKVLMAENGKIGVELALAAKPDLVVCDIMMPVLDGYGVLHIFTRNPGLSGIPFIFLTAKSERIDFRKGMELGADDYLTKPFEESELLKAIESRLNRFQNLEPGSLQSDDNPATDGLTRFLEDVRRVDNLHHLSLDRKIHLFRKKQIVYSEGDKPSKLYFLKSGKVKTVREHPGGKEFITGIYQTGDFFGYPALFDQENHQDAAVILEDSELVYIPKDDFDQLLAANPDVSRQFIQLLAGHVNDREQQLMQMAYNTIRRRVADALLQLDSQQPDSLIQLSRDNLAAFIGTAPETVIRTLSEFRQDGLIELSASGGIKVLHAEKLRRSRW